MAAPAKPEKNDFHIGDVFQIVMNKSDYSYGYCSKEVEIIGIHGNNLILQKHETAYLGEGWTVCDGEVITGNVWTKPKSWLVDKLQEKPDPMALHVRRDGERIENASWNENNNPKRIKLHR